MPERETLRALEANTPNRLTKQFVALPPTELGQEILDSNSGGGCS